MKRLTAHVSGKVQGVGYCSLVVTLARTLDLTGFIEMLSDSRAFIIAEGPQEDLTRFIRAIRIDNSKIRVQEILFDCKEATGEFSNFSEMLSLHESKIQPCEVTKKTRKRGKEPGKGNFLPVPQGLERIDRGISKINHKLDVIGSSGEGGQPEDAIDWKREDTVLEAFSSCRENRERRRNYP